MNQTIAVLNAGSSSFKFSVFAAGSGLERLADGTIEGLGRAPHFVAYDRHGRALAERSWSSGTVPSIEELLVYLIDWIEGQVAEGSLMAAGHRVVFGGQSYRAPVQVSPAVLEQLDALTPMMPLHLPHNLAPIRALTATHPRLLQVACFDTSFHQTLPRIARLFALPRALSDAGVVRYGFHGLSYEYIATALPHYDERAAAGRTIVAHLGNGASLCALDQCRSVDTTMGFSVLDGLMMGTRPGSLDPGVLLYLMREKAFDVERVEGLLYEESGLLGVSGLSSDMRTLLASRVSSAQEAVELFCRRVVSGIGSLLAPLGGFDALIFTGGIGENAAPVRRRVAQALQWLGLSLDEEANERGGPRISSRNSRVSAWVIPTDEAMMIARHTHRFLGEDASAARDEGKLT